MSEYMFGVYCGAVTLGYPLLCVVIFMAVEHRRDMADMRRLMDRRDPPRF